MKRLMLLFAALLCVVVSGCDEIYEDYYCLYFSAEIVDEEGVPIQGIYAYPEGGKFDGREGYSNHLGKIEAFGQIKPSRRFVVCIEDVDGEYNRGEYEGVAIDITNMVKAPSAPDRYGFTGSDIVDLGRVVLKRK
jgi:hypothetical protein